MSEIRISKSETSTDLFIGWREVGTFRQEFNVEETGIIDMSFNIDLKHRGLVNGPVSWGIRVFHTFAATQAGLDTSTGNWVLHAYAANNIANIEDHYDTAVLTPWPYDVEPGWHRFAIWGNSASSLAPTTDGLIELNFPGLGADYNFFRTEYKPGQSIIWI